MRYTFTLLSACLGSVCAMASHVTPEQALNRLQSAEGQFAPAANAVAARLVARPANIYVFSAGEGYMILPADDCAPALLGYASKGEFETNPALEYWLGEYSRQIQYAADNGLKISVSSPRPDREAIAPMTETRWNQGAPYNDLCPELNGTRCVTGCVATAMAQVLKFHNYPAKGEGTHSYSWSTGNQELTFDYGSTTFDWDLMTNRYDSSSTAAQKKAVATLMEACGISVNMEYTASESGAVSRHICPALIDNFRYDKALWMPERNYYGLTEWEDMIYADLAQGLPVLYGGQGSAGGHQFVCDGYSTDGYFHFNWGWGGMSDGYFLLTALDPPALGIGGGAGGFNYDQSVALGVKPAVSGSDYHYIVYCTSGFTTSTTSTMAGQSVTFDGGYYNFSFATMPDDSKLGIAIEAADGTKTYVEYYTMKGIKPLSGFSEMSVRIPADIADGTYTVTPAFSVGGKWQPVPVSLSGNPSYTMTVSNGNVTLSSSEAPEITVSGLTLTTDLYWNCDCNITFNVVNEGTDEYYGAVVPVLISADGQSLVAEGATYPVDVDGGATLACDYTGTFSTNGSAPEAGSYYLGIVDSSTGSLLGQPIMVTLNAEPAYTSISVSNLQLLSPNPVTNTSSVSFSMTVGCLQGYYAGTVTLAVFRASGGESVASKSSSSLYLGAGESSNIQVDADLAALESGNYMAAVFEGSSQKTDAVYFSIETAGLTDVNAETDSEGYFDLLGRYSLNPTRPGFYLTPGRKLIVR